MLSTQKPARRKRGSQSGARQKGRPRAGTDRVGITKVIETARRLLQERRPPQITRAEVAKAAGVDQKLVRYYFGDYEDLFDQVIGLAIQDLEAVMERASRPQKTATRVMRERVKALIGFLAENTTFLKLLVDRV